MTTPSRILAGLALALASTAAHAATTLDVTTTAMTTAADGNCSLVEALAAARTNATVNECVMGGGAPVTINLATGTYSFAASTHTDVNFGNSAALINQDVTINGNGSTINRAGGAAIMRFLKVDSPLTLRDLTISGFTSSDTAEPLAAIGGALAASATTVNIEDVTFSGNSCGFGAGVCDGAAMVAFISTVNIHRVTFDGNTASHTAAAQVRATQGSTLNVANATFAGPAIAIAVTNATNAFLSHVTATGGVGSLILDATGAATVRGSLLPGVCHVNGGTVVVTGSQSSPSCGGTGLTAVLLALTANGGPTPTRALRIPSTAKDAAPACTYLSGGANPLFANGAAIATDQRGAARDAACDLGAFESLSIAPTTLPGGTFNTPYSQALTATGGTGPYTFAQLTGAVPPGLALSAAGVVAGTPTAAGNFTFGIAVTDAGGFRSEASYAVAIARATQTITFGTLADRNFGSGSFGVAATASSSLTVSFATLTPTTCSVGGSTVNLLAVGGCTIRAAQGGNGNFFAATSVDRTFNILAVVPGAPTAAAAVPGNGQGTISFAAPAFTGGQPILGYTATCAPGGATATGPSSPLTVAGLANGTPYTCTVQATNSAGTGPASTPTASFVPVLTGITGPTATGSGIATATFTGGGATCTFAPAGNGPLQSAGFIPVSGHPKSPPVGTAPPAVAFDHGLLDFVLTGCTPGGAVTLTVTYPAPLNARAAYWKYGPEPGIATPHWYVMPATIAGNTVSFTIVDGLQGDDDLLANGTIVDQGGPGVGGDPRAVPTLSEWAMLALVALMLASAVGGLRRRPG